MYIKANVKQQKMKELVAIFVKSTGPFRRGMLLHMYMPTHMQKNLQV